MKSFEGRWDEDDCIGFFNTCKAIVENESLFNSFKTNPIFCRFIGNDIRSVEQGLNFLKNIDFGLVGNIDKYKSNDKYGDPPIHYFDETGPISCGTLYFLSVLTRIIKNLGDIKNKSICEIGSGYGGQAKILLDYGVLNYCCIDQKEPLSLAKKYLSLFGYDNVEYMDCNSIINREYDLVISNWCLSELDDEGMNFYLNEVISKSKSGYFEMNTQEGPRKQNLISKLKQIYNTVDIIPEVVNTGRPNRNFLIICK